MKLNFFGLICIMSYKIPVDIIIDADSPEEAELLSQEFMLRAASEYRKQFFLRDYEFPVGYPIEEIPYP